jgi:RNA polymerase sigma factor (sigma-70 family)
VAARINAFRFRDYGLEQADLAQDIFVRIWEYYEKNDKNIRHLESYIYRVINSVVIDAIKKARKEGAALRRLGRDASEPPNASGSKGDECNDRLRATVLSFAKKLKPSRRKVIGLYLAGLTLDEITALMNWKKSRTNNLFYRGLEDLRRKLAANGDSHED